MIQLTVSLWLVAMCMAFWILVDLSSYHDHEDRR